jgi:hypothetical protein
MDRSLGNAAECYAPIKPVTPFCRKTPVVIGPGLRAVAVDRGKLTSNPISETVYLRAGGYGDMAPGRFRSSFQLSCKTSAFSCSSSSAA